MRNLHVVYSYFCYLLILYDTSIQIIAFLTKLFYEESNLTANSSGRKFLDNSKGLDVINLLVKYDLPLVHIHNVIKLVKFKSAMNLQIF